MKFGREFQQTLDRERFPKEWVASAVEYKHLKKCIRKVQSELEEIGLHPDTLGQFSQWLKEAQQEEDERLASGGEGINELKTKIKKGEFVPQLRVLIDRNTGQPIDATLTTETKDSLKSLASSDRLLALRRSEARRSELHSPPSEEGDRASRSNAHSNETPPERRPSNVDETTWVEVPLASAQHFFALLEPKLRELEALNAREEQNLSDQIMDLGDMVQDVTEPVREGYEAKRKVSYRDLYFWREMFRLYLEKPIFFSTTERNRGALTFDEAKARLEEYDQKLRSTGLMSKMKTPLAKAAAQQFLDLNVDILRIMHFQEMNARAMRKILKKFDKQTHLEGKDFLRSLKARYPFLLPATSTSPPSSPMLSGAFANSIARDLNAEIASKVLAIVPQLDDWNCPVCYSMAWKPVNLGCCRSVFCIRCIIHLQDQGVRRCPVCNGETVMGADGRNLAFDAMDFLEKYFPLEVKGRQRENERAMLVREHGEEFVKPCVVM
ncbi:hypothetical protein K431DRAFT_277001 [Polychaeton citri CBS 116435]|uniref:SPX domain-containing protein n=1 Tax=Polychaeton citri CBS 116435 TaxID=1314669 RepID=A0A9P4UIY7_9PEZI|nr:hypothetical protein K431DRAFT_277001 [Polychaeton citri CBS 116435]